MIGAPALETLTDVASLREGQSYTRAGLDSYSCIPLAIFKRELIYLRECCLFIAQNAWIVSLRPFCQMLMMATLSRYRFGAADEARIEILSESDRIYPMPHLHTTELVRDT